MEEKVDLSRRKFISSVTLGSIGTFGAKRLLSSNTNIKGVNDGITLRPHQLLCTICSIGEKNIEGEDKRIKTIRDNPDIPVTLLCNAGDVYAYQDPGPEDDTSGSVDFNRKLDLEILQRIDLPPGGTLTARIILHRIWDRIESVSGICDCEEVTNNAWKGCPKAKSGFYEKGREISLMYAVPSCGSQTDFYEADLPKAKASKSLIIPRTKEERMEAKRKSLEAMNHAEAIPVRPHILMCAVCQYGNGSRPPFETDNLPEMIQFILKNPNAKIKMAEGADWMMCAPCPSMNKFNACVHVKGNGGLPNQLRDSRVLQKLGLVHGDVINAKEVYWRILKNIPDSNSVCGSVSIGVCELSVWHSGCGRHAESKQPYQPYVKGRELLIKDFGFNL